MHGRLHCNLVRVLLTEDLRGLHLKKRIALNEAMQAGMPALPETYGNFNHYTPNFQFQTNGY